MKTTETITAAPVLVNPTIELKNIKTFQGRDGYGLNANLYLNGEKIAFVLDEGNGGEMRLQALGNTAEEMHENTKKIELLQEYAKALPKEKVEGIVGLSEEEKWMQPDLACIVDKLFEEEQNKKFIKKLEKKMVNAILVGVPNSGAYRYFSYKVNLDKIPLANLQNTIDKTVLPSLKEGEVILNTNLKQLGVKY